jgi:pimeloyl-ACP methyl ester carboxylesterase
MVTAPQVPSMFPSVLRAIATLAVLGVISAPPMSAQRPASGSPPPAPRAGPQTSALPYRTVDVTFESVPGVRIAGTLSIPAGRGPFPAVVLVAGSGPHDRAATPYWVVADHLARHGVATLRYDKRGIARSTGDYRRSTTADFADDAEAAVRFLRGRPEVAHERVGIAGHSEGSVIAPMVAARSGEVAFIVLTGAMGLPGDSTMLLQRAAIVRARGLDPAADPDLAANQQAYAAMRAARDSADMAARLTLLGEAHIATRPVAEQAELRRRIERGRDQLLSPWWRYFATHDPRPALRQVRVPVLALTGTRDVNVPPEAHLPEIRAALHTAGNPDYHVVAVPGLHHLLDAEPPTDEAEYRTRAELISPVALELITNWILAHANRPR